MAAYLVFVLQFYFIQRVLLSLKRSPLTIGKLIVLIAVELGTEACQRPIITFTYNCAQIKIHSSPFSVGLGMLYKYCQALTQSNLWSLKDPLRHLKL